MRELPAGCDEVREAGAQRCGDLWDDATGWIRIMHELRIANVVDDRFTDPLRCLCVRRLWETVRIFCSRGAPRPSIRSAHSSIAGCGAGVPAARPSRARNDRLRTALGGVEA